MNLEAREELLVRVDLVPAADRERAAGDHVVGVPDQQHSQRRQQQGGVVAERRQAKRREPGTLPWYGPEYDLEDFIAYTFYGHKREHMAQVNVFLDTLKLR